MTQPEPVIRWRLNAGAQVLEHGNGKPAEIRGSNLEPAFSAALTSELAMAP
jgi:hypothetical protein